MRYRKIFISWFLVLGVFANTALSEVCLCGNLCSQGLRPVSETPTNLFLHLQCTGPECKRCKSEKSEKNKAANSGEQTLGIKLIKKLPGLAFGSGILSSSQSFGNMELCYDPIAIPLSPIYLVNLSLLL